MTIDDILQRLEGVSGSNGYYKAKCPSHSDDKASLSITQTDDKILLHCFAGCDNNDICKALNIEVSDLFATPLHTQQNSTNKKTEYIYTDMSGKEKYKKIRYYDNNGKKAFYWLRKSGGEWVKGGKSGCLIYNKYATKDEPIIFIVEGEKDVETLKAHNMPAVSLSDGAKSKWNSGFEEFFKDKTVKIIPDNDEPGRAYADMIGEHLQPIAKSVQLVDLSKLWHDMPEKADITDYLDKFGKSGLISFSEFAMNKAEEWQPVEKDSIFSCVQSLDKFEEKPAEWLIEGWLPKGQIIVMSGDGGVGKTSIWCNIAAALSSGIPSILDKADITREPQTVAFFTTEDSVSCKLKAKLRIEGADERNIKTIDFSKDNTKTLEKFKFGSDLIEEFVKRYKPCLCIFDPIQGFIKEGTNMGARNDMRNILSPLIKYGEKYGCTFLLISHTNKRDNASGRNRLADSSDIWDIARSVVMVGKTEDDDIKYISNEKNNYTAQQKTVLFSIDDNGTIRKTGETWNRDDYFSAQRSLARQKPKRNECKNAIIDVLTKNASYMLTSRLQEQLKEQGFSDATIRAAKEELQKEEQIKYERNGGGSKIEHYTKLLHPVKGENIDK